MFNLKKYATALASAKDYVAQWSTEHFYADDALIVPFPTLAIFNPDRNHWTINIKAWIYLPFEGKKLKNLLPSIPNLLARKNNEEKQVTTEEIIEETIQAAEQEAEETTTITAENPARLGLFFVGNSVKVLTKLMLNGVEHLLRPSDESGFVEEQLELSNDDIQTIANKIHPESNDWKFDYELQLNQTKTTTTDGNSKGFKCTVYVLGHEGVSVISDIDDTIKISRVLNKSALLKNTFYNYFKPVDGMNEIYQKWFEQKCQFHYVSASPWQLYPALRSFLEQYNYPMGTMNLRKFAWNVKFLKPSDTYKIEILIQILESYPCRKYICVGDSGELDPEIYVQLYNFYPQNIAHIFIRDLCQEPECLPACQTRYKKAFEGVPKERWTIFKDPKEIPTNIEQIISFQDKCEK